MAETQFYRVIFGLEARGLNIGRQIIDTFRQTNTAAQNLQGRLRSAFDTNSINNFRICSKMVTGPKSPRLFTHSS